MLTVRDLQYEYRKGKSVLDGVSFDLEEREIKVLLGPNGAGKSTLFKCLLGQLKPQGKIMLDGKDVTSLPARKRALVMAYIPQDITFGNLTVLDSVLVGRLARFGLAASKEDVEIALSALRDMGIADYAYRNVNQLSGGERQKVAIARAVAQEPNILICDEPTANLDIANERLLFDLLRRVARDKGIAVLVAVHDLRFATELGDSFVMLKEGKVAYSGGADVVNEQTIWDVYHVQAKIIQQDGYKGIVYQGGSYEEDHLD